MGGFEFMSRRIEPPVTNLICVMCRASVVFYFVGRVQIKFHTKKKAEFLLNEFSSCHVEPPATNPAYLICRPIVTFHFLESV